MVEGWIAFVYSNLTIWAELVQETLQHSYKLQIYTDLINK